MDDYIRALKLISELGSLPFETRFPADNSFLFPTFEYSTISGKPSISFYDSDKSKIYVYSENAGINVGTFADGLKRLEEYHDRYYNSDRYCNGTHDCNQEPADK